MNAIMTIISVLASLLLLSIFVTVHEFGHFYAGRKLGFRILEFAVGMGPVLLKKTKNGVDFTIRALPIGGMCRFYGEDSEEKDAHCFSAQAAWKRLIVVVAGPLMNLLFAFVLCVATFMSYGNFMPSIHELSDANYPAARAGILPGDVLVKVNGNFVHGYEQVRSQIYRAGAESVTFTVHRDGEELDLLLTDCYDAEDGSFRVGVILTPVRMKLGFFRSIGESVFYMGDSVGQILGFFKTLFAGKASSQDVSGPVGTVAYISEAVRSGLEMVLRFTVLINISLGICNLLPIPALDGGRLLFILVELVRGKAVAPEKEGLVHFVGIVLLLGLMVFLTYQDIMNLIRR